MALIIPNNYPITDLLREQGITCIEKQITETQAQHMLRIGIFNVMPEAEKYEFSILRSIGNSNISVIPAWIRATNHNYKSSDKDYIKQWYLTFEEAIKNEPLDGLIITGAPVETIPFEAVTYWKELLEIFSYANTNIVSTLGICWGGLAIAKIFGVEKINYAKKLFGVYASKNLNRNHPITDGLNDTFYCPQSRYAGFNENDLRIAADAGKINLLAHSEEAGHFIFESGDGRFIGHLGHHEYDAERIVFEHFRDIQKGLESAPANFDVNNPKNTWWEEGNEFFARWLKSIYSKRYGGV
ncbi:MAG: homoserine O-succinyltransferase [Chlorobiaceae bacterium]|nr:homoserine O-succinyltransferase [Chlorobiaceae bacterium]